MRKTYSSWVAWTFLFLHSRVAGPHGGSKIVLLELSGQSVHSWCLCICPKHYHQGVDIWSCILYKPLLHGLHSPDFTQDFWVPGYHPDHLHHGQFSWIPDTSLSVSPFALGICKFFLEGILVLHIWQRSLTKTEDSCLFSNPFVNGINLSEWSQVPGCLSL